MYEILNLSTKHPAASVNTTNETQKKDGRVQNNPRAMVPDLFISLMDAKPDPSRQPKLDSEVKAYQQSVWTKDEKVPHDLVIIKKHGPLLFYKENEKDFPILCELARAIYCVMASSTPIESVFSGCKQTTSPLRSRTRPGLVKDLTCLRKNLSN